MRKVNVSGLAIDSNSNSPVVLLKESGGSGILPIWIGPAEASAIAMELAGLNMKRPLTHDLLRTVIDGLGAKVLKVVVNDLVGQTFYAEIYLQHENSLVKIDARPSDSIALALKAKAPIFVSKKIFAFDEESSDISEEQRAEELRARLQRINPEDFGNYTF
ncbi:MAG: bifunctional nuclease family protein [Gemmatimonadota bacterium]|nr:MAG: bifunctional nuclease family protein [Gemmatimonadota bacterium]